jgi:DNA-binding IclR family transcriptional regulator
MNTSALHIFQVLRVLSRSREPLGVSELSRRVGLSPSTAHRALVTLEEARYLKRAPYSSKFMAGPMTQSLARSLFRHFKLRQAGHPILQQLEQATGATISLSVRVGWYAMRILVVSPSHLVYAQHRLGETRPLHETMEGRAILAELDEDEASHYRRFVRTHHPGSVSEIERSAFWKDVRTIRAQIVVTEESATGGLRHSATSLRLPDGRPVAALLASLPIASAAQNSTKALPASLKLARDKLEALIAQEPATYLNRFSGIDPDQIFFPSENVEEAT